MNHPPAYRAWQPQLGLFVLLFLARGGMAAEPLDAARQRWPFVPPADPVVPSASPSDWPWNPIDHFVLAKLNEHGLTPVADADKRTLIRRLTYDLTGLPPTPADIDNFLADTSSMATATVVERLLSSPQYGERWGRHWLDVVRYADTAGDNSDYPIPQMYRYRNWVITAFDRDKPYDQFIREQIAGDLLPASDAQQKYEQIIATGYIANARRFGSRVDDYPQHLTIEDTIDNLGKTFLGLSVNCARCHNHKFDPITVEDYYALYGFFHSTRYPWPGIELDKRQRNFVPLAPDDQVAAVLGERQAKLGELSAAARHAEQGKVAAEKSAKELAKQVAESRQGEGESSEEFKNLHKQWEEAKAQLEKLDQALKTARKARDDFDKSPLPFELAYAVAEGKKVENVKLHMKGDPERPGAEIPRRIPLIFGGQPLPQDEKGSGRRTLAEWIASPQNPLTARVLVNRLWYYHFGQALVPTPNDFGKQGKPPSHPELLDYLARRFVESGWSVKAIHRLIVLSRTYQLSSQDDASGLRKDPGNTWLWRGNRRRLDAESIRDTLLFLGGNLDLTMGGPHPFPPEKDWDFTQHNPFKAVYDTNRRSVYLMTQRIQRHPYLGIFDGADTGASTGSRITSTTTLQALYLLNDQFVHQQADRLAARLRELNSDDAGRIELGYRMVFGRSPTDEEQARGIEYLAKVRQQLTMGGVLTDESAVEAWNSFVRVLFRMNEFVYVN